MYEPNIILGYPIVKNQNNNGYLYPIPELLSYEGFLEEISEIDNLSNNNFYFKSANNELYNYWLPIYINEFHFLRNKTTIFNSFSIIRYGYLGKKEFDFKPRYIFEILPSLLNNMILSMSFSQLNISESFLRCFFQYALLYKKLFQLFKKQYRKYINIYLDVLLEEIKDYKEINSGQLFVMLNYLFLIIIFSNEDINCLEMRKTKEYLLSIRDILKNELCFKLLKKKIWIIQLNLLKIYINIIYLMIFSKQYALIIKIFIFQKI